MRLLRSTLMALCLTAIAALPGCRRAPAPLTAAEEQAIGDSIVALATAADRAVDNLDCPRGVASFAESEPLFVSNGRVIDTRAQLAAACQQMIAGRTGATYAVERASPHVLSRDAVYLVRQGTYTITWPDRVDEHYLVISDIWVRRAGQWKRVHFHESGRPITAPPDAKAK